MERQVFFISGCYGVGKSTLCDKLSHSLQIPSYSASDLISIRVNEQYGAQKSVKDKNVNQQALIHAVQDIPVEESKIILSGHFCIFNRNKEVDLLPESVFSSLEIKKIILLETDPIIISERLLTRDNVSYPIESIKTLIDTEHNQALAIAEQLKCPLLIHKMQFNNSDVVALSEFLSC